MNGFIVWITAWALLIALIVATSRLQPGEKLLSYALWLAIALIIVTHAQEISQMFANNILTQGQA